MTRSLVPDFFGGKDKNGDVFSSLHREIDRVFDEFTNGEHWPFRALAKDNGRMSLRLDISETETDIEVTADLPGVDEKDVEISLADDRLTIKGEKKAETETKEKDHHLLERSYGSFERMTTLPCDVDAEKVKAEFKDGVLKITLPKAPEAKAKTRKIAITQ
jgi:HSP20 family protein